MITGFFLQIGLSLLQFFVGLLPVIAFPTQITTAFQTVWGYVNAFSFIFPVATLVQVLVIAGIFHLTILGWRMANWVGGYLRGK